MPDSSEKSALRSWLAKLRHQSFKLNWAGVTVLVLTGFLLAWSLSFYSATVNDVNRTQEFLSRIQYFQTTLEDMETGQRGFLITGAERYLEPYYAALARVELELRMLRRAAIKEPSLLAQVDRISVVTKEKLSELQEAIQLRREEGEDAARAVTLSDRGLRSMSEIRAAIAKVEFDVSAHLTGRIEQQQQHLYWIEIAAFSGLLLGLTFILLAGRQIRRAERVADLAEEARKQQEGEFRLLADSIPQLAWMANADGGIFWYNRRWFEFTGTTPEQMEGWGWQSVHHPATLPQVLEVWKTSIATGLAFEMQFPLRGANGAFRSFLTRIVPLKNDKGEVVRWFGTNTDITEHLNAERATAQLAAIIESSEDAIVGKSLNGKIESWNAGAAKIYGYSASEILGQSMNVLLPPELLNEEMDILQRIRKGEQVSTIETTRLKKGGSRLTVSLTVSPIHNQQGEIIGASHIARDITEQKQFQSRMQEMQKLESLGVLAGGIAHDFNNLLTGIMGNASLAMERIPARDRHFLEAVVTAAERSAALTHQLLAYAGKGRFVIEAVDLSKLAKEISQLVEASIPRKVHLRLELDRELPRVDGDSSQLQQVIMNLLINGAEAIGEENGTVTIRTWVQDVDDLYLHTVFSDSSLHAGRYVALEVNDTGTGMDQLTLSKIFDPFFTTKFTGRGLGLAAVQGIVRSHHGAIKVYSNPGQGTTFKVLLPVAEVQKLVPAPKEISANPLHGHGHVLIVDDEEIIRDYAKSAMEHYGYSVTLAHDGQEALDMFSRSPNDFQLVFLDLTMPVMDGEEAFARLQIIRPGVPVLLTSGFNASTAVRHFSGKGLAGFLQKPYTAVQLAEKLKAALSNAEAISIID